MAREAQTPTPSRDVDVFGKELPLTSAEKQILSGVQTIFLRKALSIEIIVKKAETTEPRVLVISSSKCFLLSNKPAAKLETSFNFLRIQKLECTESTLTFHLSREQRALKFHLDRRDSVEILGLITAQLKNVFPITPLDMIIQTSFSPSSLQDDTAQLRDNLLTAMDRLDPSSLRGFITTYGFLCDFFTVPFNEEVTWYLKNVYLTHGFRDLKLHDFNHLSTKEVRPIVSAIRHNEFFEGIIEKDNRTDAELLEEVGYVLNASRSIKTLVLNNCSLKPDNVVRLAVALKNNPKPSLTYLDLSHNPLDDKAVESLGSALESLTHGLHDLRLANCKISPRAATQLANCMMANKLMKNSLVHLDLSSNPLGPDPQGSLGFLKEAQTVATIKLSNCGLSFEFVTPVLIRGCQQFLRDLDLSMNAGRSRRGGIHGPKVASELQQFCSSAISIAIINLSGCKLSGEMTVGLLEGLCANPNVQNIDLNLSGNDLGSGRDPTTVAKAIARTSCLERVDVSESGIDGCLVSYIAAIKLNKNITHLNIGKNFNGKGNSRTMALKRISQFLASDDCHLLSLCLADSHLRDQTTTILDALASNSSLTKLDISGNGMGNHGARRLAKTLLSNCRLQEVVWDRNETTLHGFRDVATSMEHNYTLRVMPLPLHDIGKAAVREPHEVETEVQKMQVYLCRNHSDERLKVELAARHRQRLLTATQQSGLVSRELVQLEDLLKWSERGLGDAAESEGAEIIAEAIFVREEANKVVQLTDGLYSPHVENEQFESVSSRVAELLDELMGSLHQTHVQENAEHMVSQSLGACPSLLSDKDRNILSKLVVTEMGSEFEEARKTVVHKVVPEIINPISASNLDLAATISELLVEKTLLKLERINSKLMKLQKALQKKTSSGATPDQKVSRAFTFRVEGEEHPKVKRRRPLSTNSDVVDLPSSPLETEAPQLQHISKSRPKPARLQKGGGGGGQRRPHKPAHLSSAKDEVDVGDFVKAVKDAEENSVRLAALDDGKATIGVVDILPVVMEATETKTEPEPLPEEKAEPVEVEAEPAEKEEEPAEEVEPAERGVESAEGGAEPPKWELEPMEDNDSEEKEEETEKNAVEKPSVVTEKVESKPAARSPPHTPPPSPPPSSPPPSTLSPPLITTSTRTDDSTNDNADESSSSLETAKKETSPSPSEESNTLSKDRKKSRKELKKEEKDKKEREKEEREREKREREERERQRKERERERREREEKERERREREEKLKKEKRRGSDDLLAVNGGRDQRETSPGRGFEKRKSKTVKETRKKGGLSKLFSRPKGKEEGADAGTTSDPEENVDIPSNPKPHKSPRRQVTLPSGDGEGEGEQRTSMTPEPLKRMPPRVKSKPTKSKSVDHGMEGRGEGEGEGEGEERRRKPIGGVAAMPLAGIAPSQLVLKPRPSPQPRSKPSSSEGSPALSERTASDSAHSSSPLTSHKTPPIAPRPRPKPKPRKISAVDVKDGEEEDSERRTSSKVPLKPPSRTSTPTVPPDLSEGADGGGDKKEREGETGGPDDTSQETENGEAIAGTSPPAATDDSTPQRSQTLV